jgi:hypothetical protein
MSENSILPGELRLGYLQFSDEPSPDVSGSEMYGLHSVDLRCGGLAYLVTGGETKE